MKNVKLNNNDEIDIFEIFGIIWNSRWVVVAITTLVLFYNVILLLNEKPIYSSRIEFLVQSVPPHFKQNFDGKLRVISDLQSRIFSKKFFLNWKKSTKSKNLNYDDVKSFEEIEGVSFSLSEKDRPIKVTVVQRRVTSHIRDSYIEIQIANHVKLNEFYNFVEYINEDLNKTYLMLVERKITDIETQLKKFENYNFVGKKSIDDLNIKVLLSSKDFVNSNKLLSNILYVSKPTKPIKISPNIKLTLIIWGFVGVTIGIFFVLFRHAYRRYKKKL
jgi:LPS O-antigen subunit length determinant protein (WzzB/FepE family)